MRICRWHCGGQTKNISGICDLCWRDRERIYAYRKAREAGTRPDPKKVEAGKRSAAKKKAAIQQHLPVADTLGA
jgi:hypothetical protein